MPADPHAARLAAIDAAREVLSRCGEPPAEPVVVEISAGGVTIRVELKPEREPGEPLSACERDALEILANAPEPWTGDRVCRELETAGRFHGETTVKRALTRLARDGYLVARTRAPRGYHLPGRFESPEGIPGHTRA